MDWVKRCEEYTLTDGKSGFSINFAGMDFKADDIAALAPARAGACAGIADIESGKIKNPDEQRKVTHFRPDSLPGKQRICGSGSFCRKNHRGRPVRCRCSQWYRRFRIGAAVDAVRNKRSLLE